jgi:hypothetical protein
LSKAIFENLYQEDLYTVRTSLLIVVARNWENISEDEKTLLAKILGSVRTNLSSAQVIVRPSLSIQSLKVLAPAKIIVFGSATEESITPYQNQSIDGISVIKADDFPQLDDAKKKNLWLALRQMFGV